MEQNVDVVIPAAGPSDRRVPCCARGDHFPGGMFIAFGPGIGAGWLERTVSILDFAPTFARMLDVQLDDVDGKPIHELLAATVRNTEPGKAMGEVPA